MENRRILIVDDSPLILSIMGDLLSPVPGLEIAQAGSGTEALALLTEGGRWDLVFLDIEMPGMGGLELLATLGGRPEVPFPKVVAMSGDSSAELKARLAALGVPTLLVKPVEAETLYALVGRPKLQGPSRVPAPERWPPSLDFPEVLKQFSGDLRFFDRSLTRFLDEYGVWAGRSNLADTFSDRKEVRFFLHTVKGLAAFLGADTVVKEASGLQKELTKDGDWGPVPPGTAFLEAFRRFHSEALTYLGTRDQKPDSPPPAGAPQPEGAPLILIVDDQALNREVLRQALMAEYRILEAESGAQALKLAAEAQPDLILLDVVMPGMSGLETCRALKSAEDTRNIPVIFVTSQDRASDEESGFQAGGVDYIHKPANPPIIRVRVKIHLRLSDQKRALEHLVEGRTREILEIQHEVVKRLSIASEYKDSDTGTHIMRIGRYAAVLAEALGVPTASLPAYRDAASLHDIGKIGIPDAILLKPGKLNEEEWEVMKTHTTIGSKMLDDLPQSLFQLSASSALNHHEKWDGTGYPRGLKGKDIPLIGRIVAVCDVFDALTSDRPYKKAWPLDRTLEHLREGRGRHFDPEVLDAFFACQDRLVEISRDR